MAANAATGASRTKFILQILPTTMTASRLNMNVLLTVSKNFILSNVFTYHLRNNMRRLN